MARLKADFHSHSSDDPYDDIDYTSEMLIDAVAEKGFDVLALACHATVVYDAYLAAYARERGVLLVPALEAEIEGRHVVLLNPDRDQAQAATFAQLRALGRRNSAVIAPHPFFPSAKSLNRKLHENIDLFDAIEYCNYYLPGLNLNRRAVRCAKEHGLPMVGTSDSHVFPYSARTFTWVDAERSVASVIEAIRCGRVQVQTRPQSLLNVMAMTQYVARSALPGRYRKSLRRRAAS